MKKTLISICLIALVGLFVCSAANADETYCGTARVLAIQLLPSAKDTDVPLGACTVILDFLPPSGQRNTIVATAFGTQLNLALLKACNFNETIGMCVIWRFGTSSFRVSNVLFVNPETGSDAGSVVFPKMTQEDANKLK